MTRHTATRSFYVTAEIDAYLSCGEVRYTFSVTPGRNAVIWANASEGFSPAEELSVDLHSVEVRMRPQHPWRAVDGFAFDMLSSDVPNDWFIAQIKEQDA